MKKLFVCLALLLLNFSIYAQVPQGINYQAVIRNIFGMVEPNVEIALTISILESSTDGNSIFSETHSVTTNAYGLVNITIGSINSSAFTSIDWSSGPYFIEVSINGTVIGTSEILSVPYALYAETAEVANAIDFNNVTNRPDVSDWDKDVSDDFDGQYSSLEGAPTDFWDQNNTNLYYTAGSVGINIDESTGFGGAALHVGGAIRYEGVPSETTAGLLYYDNSGNGAFKYYDNTGTAITLGTGDITYTGSYEANVSGDIVRPNDYIIEGSMEIGSDGANGYNFGFNTLVFAENNLRVLFDDTDTQEGYPNTDWQIEINDSKNGGTNHFAINDVTDGTTPFKIVGNAPDNSLYISENGSIGIGTNMPSEKLTVAGNIKADSFIGDGSALTGITGATGGISNSDDTTIGADSDDNTVGEIAFQTQNTTRMTITNAGNVGIGTTTPSAQFEVNGTAKFKNLEITGSIKANGILKTISSDASTANSTIDYDVVDKSVISFTNNDGDITISGFQNGVAGQELTLLNNGVSNIILSHNGTGSQKILLAGSTDLTLASTYSVTFICDGSNWYCISKTN